MPKAIKLVTCLALVAATSIAAYAQSNKTPEGRVQNFYNWYLISIDDEQDPAKNKAVMYRICARG